MTKHLNPAEVVIAELGIRPLARELNTDPRTISRWRESGLVPSRYHVAILETAKRFKVRVTERELIHGRDAA